MPVLARVLAAASFGRYGHQQYIANQILPDTADEETLLRMAQARLKRGRLQAVAASGVAAFTGAASAVLDAGTLLQRDDGVRFRVTVTATLAGAAGVAKRSLGTRAPGQHKRRGRSAPGVARPGRQRGVYRVSPRAARWCCQESVEALRARVIRSYRVIPTAAVPATTKPGPWRCPA